MPSTVWEVFEAERPKLVPYAGRCIRRPNLGPIAILILLRHEPIPSGNREMIPVINRARPHRMERHSCRCNAPFADFSGKRRPSADLVIEGSSQGVYSSMPWFAGE